MSLYFSTQLRNVFRSSTLRQVTSLTTDEELNTKESENSEFPDFTILPHDTSSIPPNSPYYLYNLDPSTMSKNYMNKIASSLKKKDLMKLIAPKTKESRAKVSTPEQLPSHTAAQPTKTKRLKSTLLDANALPHRVAVDFSFSHLMNPLEMRSAGVQLIHLLNINSTCRTPLQVHVTNYQGCIQDHVLNLRKKMKAEHVHLSPFHFTEVFKRDKVVYLSAESDNVLEWLDPSLVYIIGGLVDARCNIKGASLQAATDAGVSHARLPLRELFISGIPRPLPINVVYALLLNFKQSNNWVRAIIDTLHPNNFLAFKVRQPLGTHIPSNNFPDKSN